MSAKGHHVISVAMCVRLFVALLFLTVITVVASRIDFGVFNFTIAMLIASVKAMLVVMFFMGLKYDSNENRAIFFSSLIFVFIFIFLTGADLFFRRPLISTTLKLEQVPALTLPPPASHDAKSSEGSEHGEH